MLCNVVLYSAKGFMERIVRHLNDASVMYLGEQNARILTEGSW